MAKEKQVQEHRIDRSSRDSVHDPTTGASWWKPRKPGLRARAIATDSMLRGVRLIARGYRDMYEASNLVPAR
jgi:hypothetical protein